jgi:type I restriction enzyme R subunit
MRPLKYKIARLWLLTYKANFPFQRNHYYCQEFDAILNHLAKGNVFKDKTLRDRFQLTKEDGTSFYVCFFNTEDNSKNLFQVTNQISLEGSYKNRMT